MAIFISIVENIICKTTTNKQTNKQITPPPSKLISDLNFDKACYMYINLNLIIMTDTCIN